MKNQVSAAMMKMIPAVTSSADWGERSAAHTRNKSDKSDSTHGSEAIRVIPLTRPTQPKWPLNLSGKDGEDLSKSKRSTTAHRCLLWED